MWASGLCHFSLPWLVALAVGCGRRGEAHAGGAGCHAGWEDGLAVADGHASDVQCSVGASFEAHLLRAVSYIFELLAKTINPL